MFVQACFAAQNLAARSSEMSRRREKKKTGLGTQMLTLVRIILMNMYMFDLELYILRPQKPGK